MYFKVAFVASVGAANGRLETIQSWAPKHVIGSQSTRKLMENAEEHLLKEERPLRLPCQVIVKITAVTVDNL